MWTGEAGAATWSPHPAATPAATLPVAHWPRSRNPTRPGSLGVTRAAPGPPPPPAGELPRVAAAPGGQRNRQLWESTRNLYNLVATGALIEAEVHQGLLAAADRRGLLAQGPRQPPRTLASRPHV